MSCPYLLFKDFSSCSSSAATLGKTKQVSCHLGYDMLDRLHIEKRLEETDSLKEKIAYCKASWGIYCYESVLASFHNRLPAVREPSVPRLFHDPKWDLDDVANFDIFGEEFTSSSYSPAFAPGVFNAQCDLVIFEQEVNKYNKEIVGSKSGKYLRKRRALYNRLRRLRSSLPNHLQNDHNSTPGTNLLRLHYDEIAMFILRPVNPSQLCFKKSTAYDLHVEHSQSLVQIAENHFHTHLRSDYTIMFMHGTFHVTLTLVPFLDEPICQNLFTRAAAAFHRGVQDIPGMQLVLSAVEAVVWAMKKEIPSAAKASFKGQAPKDVNDVSMEWVFPQLEYVQSQAEVSQRIWKMPEVALVFYYKSGTL
ncbi:unnamed protein product [Periconia digitata]|uniref:Uncharacterized protein n=1 Tax=Periconia digitata TaxID=1303443 RepID=A0A9W4XJD5_9PLEO|nr:unnamed protein product [Periconia digitata]